MLLEFYAVPRVYPKMSPTHDDQNHETEHISYDHPVQYRIVVAGALKAQWASWFDGFSLTDGGDTTILLGTIPDQAALHGLLASIRDLGLILLSVERIQDNK
jgi:hypothetical protein